MTPQADLRVYGDVPPDLEFLRHYPALEGFVLDCATSPVGDASGLRHLPESLQRLELDVPLPRQERLDTLYRFRALRTLTLRVGKQLPKSVAGLPVNDLTLVGVRSLEGIGVLSQVTALRLQSVTADLTPLGELAQLAELTLALGGSHELMPLSLVTSLRRFSAWRVRGLHDVSPLAQHAYLEMMHLEQMKQVNTLPSFGGAAALATVTLQHMRGLRDLTPLRDAPALRVLQLPEMQHLEVEGVVGLAGHPTLEKVGLGLGSHKKNLAVQRALRLPDSYGDYDRPQST